MSVRAVCPECGTTASLEEYSHKKSIICKECGASFPVRGAKATGPPPIPKKLESANAGFEILDDDEVSDIEEVEPEERPRRPASRSRDDDEEAEERAPKSRRNRDDDEGHSPPRRRPGDRNGEREPKGSKKGLLIVGLMLLLILGAGGAFAVYKFVLDDEEPKFVVNSDDKRPEPEPEKPDPKIPDLKMPVGKVTKPRDLALSPVKMVGDRQSLQLPGKVVDVCAGAEGRFLFLHCEGEKTLVVYDVCQAGIVTEIPTTGSDTKFAAGLSKLFIANNTTRTIQRFDLLSLEKDKEAKFPFEGIIKDFSLGAASTGPALVLMNIPADSWPVQFLDQDSLAPADVGWGKPVPNGLPRDIRFQASAYGTKWVGTPKTEMPHELIFVEREGKAVFARSHECGENPGFAAHSADGTFVYSRFGAAYAFRVTKYESSGDSPLFVAPGTSSQFYLDVSKEGESDFRVQVKNPDCLISGTPVAIPQPYRPGGSFPPDQRLHYVPEAHAAIILAPDSNRLDTVRIDPLKNEQAVCVTSNPNLTFTPGKPLTYSIRTFTNYMPLKFVVEEHEELNISKGVTISPAGLLKWDVPANETRDRLRIVVKITNRSNRTSLLYISLHNTNAVAPNKPVSKPKDPKEPMPKDPKSPDPKIPTANIAPGVKLVQETGAKLPIMPPMMTESRIEVALPAAIGDACVAGGGRYLVFHCPKARNLVLFDVNTLKLEKPITVISDDVLFAAGMNKLMVIYPDSKDIIRYDLATLKLETNEVLEVRQRPTVAGMGSGVAGPLILGGIPSQNNASKMALTFLDPDTLKEVRIEKAEGEFKVTFAAAAKMRVSANGATIGAWFEQLQPTGLQIARLSGNTISGSYLADSVGNVSPGPDGQKVFTEKGLFDAMAKPEGPRTSVVPASQGIGHVSLAGTPGGKQQVAVWGPDKEKPLFQSDELPGFDGKRDPFERDNPNLALDRRLFFIPDAKILVVVPPAANKLLIYRLDTTKK